MVLQHSVIQYIIHSAYRISTFTFASLKGIFLVMEYWQCGVATFTSVLLLALPVCVVSDEEALRPSFIKVVQAHTNSFKNADTSLGMSLTLSAHMHPSFQLCSHIKTVAVTVQEIRAHPLCLTVGKSIA